VALTWFHVGAMEDPVPSRRKQGFYAAAPVPPSACHAISAFMNRYARPEPSLETLGHAPSPVQLFLRVLLIVFVVEGTAMLLLPLMRGATLLPVDSFVDEVLCMSLIAPLLWFSVVRPLRGAALREHARAATVVAHACDGIVTVDDHGVVQSFNPAAVRIFGYAAEEVVGRPVTMLVPERYRHLDRRRLEHLTATNASLNTERALEAYGLRRDGTKFPAEISLATWRIREGTFHTAVVRDVSKREQAEKAIRRRTSQLETVRALAAEITRELDLSSLLGLLTRLAAELIGVKNAGVWLWDEPTQQFCPRTWRGWFADGSRAAELRLGEGFARIVASQRRGVIVDDCSASPYAFRELAEALGTSTLVVQSLAYRGRLLGVIVLTDPGATRAFTEQDLEMLGLLADQAAIAIENARLYEAVQSLAVAQERQRLAREMHDSFAQTLGLLQMQLRQAQEEYAASDSRLSAVFGKMAATTEHAYDEARQFIFGLRTMVSRGLGWIPTLTEYLHEFSTRTGILVMLKTDDELPDRLPPATETQLIRIIQEALANVYRHAGTDHARVRLEREERELRVTVEDDGRGFHPDALDASKRGHFGLAIMRERAEGLGGTLEVDSAPGRGTRVTATLPGEV
jgi:PAS domain S-box-containing protein